MAEPLLRVIDLRVAHRSAVALDGVSFSLAAGGRLTVAGPNGAGKSSLLRAVAGLLAWSGGRVTGGRVDVAGGATVRLALEGRRVFPDLTVEENLRTGASSLPRGRRAERVAWALDRVGLLAARRDVRAGHLSGGEQQLLAIARALVPSPDVLLLDEPTVGLARASVELVSALVAGSGAAVVVAEQEPALLPEAEVMWLDRGCPVMPPAPVAPVAAPAPA
ncbi:MAG: ATP-binding cassette domain-containing protein [Acidimicrobiales bacterium]